MTEWHLAGISVEKVQYKCGYCDNLAAPSKGFRTVAEDKCVYFCPYCDQPTYFDTTKNEQVPGIRPGADLRSISGTAIGKLYDEARNAISKNAYTGAVMICRKILMHVAHEKGAPAGDTFANYIEYLSTKGYIPPDGKGWVDEIRSKGNEANHEIIIISRDDAYMILTFTEHLLRFVYELSASLLAYQKKKL